jgi:hypothetical protein
VAERAPGPLGAVAGVAANAVGTVADAVSGGPDDEQTQSTQENQS